MSELGERLERLGLAQYHERFVAEGFDSWETVLDITESDLSTLGVKLGHRRKLQRAIAESRGPLADRLLPIVSSQSTAEGPYRSANATVAASEGIVKQIDLSVADTSATSTKRKYRRHPKADEHAPERPPSAYVIFSNQVRETLRGQDLSFTEIAKVVGERWQVLPADSRESCERQANTAKEKYYAELAEYKKTAQFAAYQKYLEDFRAKHAAPPKTAEGKRSRLETETSMSTIRSNSHDRAERPWNRRVSTADSDSYTASHYLRSESSPPLGPSRLPSGPVLMSKSTSPASRIVSGVNSPRIAGHYSPLSASPRSATLQKESSFELHPKDRPLDASYTPGPSTYGLSHHPSSRSPPSAVYGSQFSAPIDLPSRRSFREPTRLPLLSHEDTTLSSEGSAEYGSHNPSLSGHTPSLPGSLLPVADVPKSMRLPQPVPSMGQFSSPLDRPMPSASSQQQQSDYRTSASLAALLRASEMAREAGDEDMGNESLP